MVGGGWCSGIVCIDGFSGSEDLGGGDGDGGVVSLFMMFCEMVGLSWAAGRLWVAGWDLKTLFVASLCGVSEVLPQ